MDIKKALQECMLDAEGSRAEHTARAYKYALRLFQEYLEENKVKTSDPISSITLTHFIRYPGWLARQDYSKRTISLYVSGANFFLEWLVIQGILEPSYSETIRLKAATKSASSMREYPLPRWPKRGDVDKMLEAVHQLNESSPRLERDIALIEVLACTGCRANEVAQLSVRDINLIERSAIVTGKGKKQRYVFFNKSAIEALKAYWVARGYSAKDDPVFARHDKGAGKKHLKITTRTIQKVVNDVLMLAGIDKFSPHYFRHGFAIKTLNETDNLAMVQDLLGHASPHSTRVYAKIYPEDLQRMHRKVFD
jgi:site-specific recombinase XerD